jgi:O-antigen ligase
METQPLPALGLRENRGASRVSGVLWVVAGLALTGNCLLNSPGRFSEQHYQDRSALRSVVEALALGGAYPTIRGVEIRDLMFFMGAAALAFLGGFRLLLPDYPARLSADDLLDFRARASSPCFWWCMLLLVSVVSSVFSHAPQVCKGQTIIRFMQAAWWYPLALFLSHRHVRRLAIWLGALLGVLAILALWYHYQRPQPRLGYPMGNELFLAACLLPGLFLAFGFLGDRLCAWRGRPTAGSFPTEGAAPAVEATDPPPAARRPVSIAPIAICVLGATVILLALCFTRSRSALVGLLAGAATIIFFAAPRKGRPLVVLATVVLALVGALAVQHLRAEGVMGQRAHSIRARLDYEWPYALALFFQKPVAGQGDGAYAMLAGQIAREEQLDDPRVSGFDESNWPAHADNEFLELLADLGLAGMFAFAAAIALTLYWALRWCDRRRLEGDPQGDRWLVIGLASGLIAVALEECSDVALRMPGLPPIFLTIWAALWAVVKSARLQKTAPQAGGQPLGPSALRLTGTVACLLAAALGVCGISNWRGALAQYRATTDLQQHEYAEAARQADQAVRGLLDSFQRLASQVYAAWARSLQFDQILAQSEAPPAEADLEPARAALMQLDWLKRAAPRFLRAARLEADLSLNLSRAHARRGEAAFARDYYLRCVQALEQHRADEPFRFEAVADLWRARPNARAVERLWWLRCLLRNGEIETGFVRLFRELANQEDFDAAMSDLLNVAAADQSRPPRQWADRLSPETFRVAALDRALLADQPQEAARLAEQAEGLYRKAGPRLFAPHAAALHEMVRYSFDADPVKGTAENLSRLAEAQTVAVAPAEPTTPLPAALGYTRVRVLLAAGREGEAEIQIRALRSDGRLSMSEALADGYLSIASQFADRVASAELALHWAQRAAELAPELPEVHAVMIRLFLRKGQDAAALEAAERYLRSEANGETTHRFLGILESRYPGSTVWAELRRRHADLPSPPSTQPEARPPTSNPATEQAPVD